MWLLLQQILELCFIPPRTPMSTLSLQCDARACLKTDRFVIGLSHPVLHVQLCQKPWISSNTNLEIVSDLSGHRASDACEATQKTSRARMGNILSRMNLLSVKVLGLFFCEDQYQKRVTILRKAGGLLSLLLLITFALFCAVLTLVRFVSFLINSSAHSVGTSFTLCTILFHFFFWWDNLRSVTFLPWGLGCLC